jgi:hypothetical protein
LLNSVDQEQLSTAIEVAATALIVLFIFLVVGTVARQVRHRKERQEPRRIEPKLTADYDDDKRRSEDSEGDGAGLARPFETDASPRRPRRRHSLVTAVLSFIVGVSVGAGSYSLAARQDVGSIDKAPKSARRDAATATVTGKEIGRSVAGSIQSDPAVAYRLANYMEKTNKKLPEAIDAITTMVFVESEDRSVTGGFQVARSLSDSDVATVGQSIETKAKSTICELSDSDDVRYLNDNGIAFTFIYVDKSGRTIVEFTLPKHLCSH